MVNATELTWERTRTLLVTCGFTAKRWDSPIVDFEVAGDSLYEIRLTYYADTGMMDCTAVSHYPLGDQVRGMRARQLSPGVIYILWRQLADMVMACGIDIAHTATAVCAYTDSLVYPMEHEVRYTLQECAIMAEQAGSLDLCEGLLLRCIPPRLLWQTRKGLPFSYLLDLYPASDITRLAKLEG